MPQFSLRLPDDLYERLRAYAEAEAKSVNQAILDMIREKLRDERWRDAVAKMRGLRGKLAPLRSDPAEIIRELREERADRV